MNDKRVARHYAEALFMQPKNGGKKKSWEKQASLKQIFEEDAELQKILSHPLISPQEKEQALKVCFLGY